MTLRIRNILTTLKALALSFVGEVAMSTLWTSSVHCCNSAKPKNSELGINSVDGNKEGGKDGEGGCGGVPSIEPNQNTTMEC